MSMLTNTSGLTIYTDPLAGLPHWPAAPWRRPARQPPLRRRGPGAGARPLLRRGPPRRTHPPGGQGVHQEELGLARRGHLHARRPLRVRRRRRRRRRRGQAVELIRMQGSFEVLMIKGWMMAKIRLSVIYQAKKERDKKKSWLAVWCKCDYALSLFPPPCTRYIHLYPWRGIHSLCLILVPPSLPVNQLPAGWTLYSLTCPAGRKKSSI